MLAAKRQARKRAQNTGDTATDEVDSNNLAIYLLAIPLLASPSAIILVNVVNAGFAGSIASMITGHAALIAVMATTGTILCMTVLAEGWLNEKIAMVFSRITTIILTGLSVRYVIDGMSIIGLITP